MSPPTTQPTREEVLDAFAVEPSVGRETLERYLREYPQFALELVDLSRELSRVIVDHEGALSETDMSWIDAAWKRHVDAAPPVVSDPFTSLSVGELRAIAARLDVPRQVITAFRERKVDVASVPRPFMTAFAGLMKTALEPFIAVLSDPPQVGLARSYKANERPEATARASFEQILIDAGVSAEKRASLLARGD